MRVVARSRVVTLADLAIQSTLAAQGGDLVHILLQSRLLVLELSLPTSGENCPNSTPASPLSPCILQLIKLVHLVQSLLLSVLPNNIQVRIIAAKQESSRILIMVQSKGGIWQGGRSSTC